MNVYGEINGTLSTPIQIVGMLSGESKIVGTLTIPSSNANTYSGAYVFTPTEETQTAETAQCILLDNITINPIPSNYGLLTWNGNILTVS